MMVAPAIEDFVFTMAMRVDQTEFLHGARHAAAAVNQARRAAMQGDARYMEALERSHSLTPALHSALEDELRRACDASDAMRDELDDEQSCLDAGTVELSHTHLVVGAMRDYFPQRAEGRKVLSLGSHLSVCGREEDNLWSIDTQGQLLEDEGCSIRLTVSLGSAEQEASAADAAKSVEYVFEAAVDCDMILERPGHDELHFQLADIQGRTDGDAFWSRAQAVGMDTLWKA